MSQVTKTICFVVAAIATTALAFATRPARVEVDAVADGRTKLSPDFTDPLTAKSLKIVRFDETLASLSEIEIKETDGIWSLPSHDGYPADAENRIRDATTPFVGLESLSWVSDSDGDHSLYGVAEPGANTSSVGDQGVGTLVTVKNAGGNNLVNLIIGKEVKDNEELRYVRQAGRARVYVAKVDPSSLPVRFEDWIEKDLLKIDNWDIQQLVLKDYTFQVAATLTGARTDYDQRLQMTVTDDNGTWTLDDLQISDGDRLEPSQLGEGEELNTERLNGLKEALADLEIVNVERKPANLGADLRAEKGLAEDQAGIDSLLQRGFYPVRMPDGELEVLSADGEVLVRSKEGVEYVLRFGGIEGVDTESDEGKLNRFLLVTARIHQDHFPEPDLEAIPETVDDLKRIDAGETTEQPDGQETSSAGPSDQAVSRTIPVALLQDDDATDVDETTAANDGDVSVDDSANDADDGVESATVDRPGDAGADASVADEAQSGGDAAAESDAAESDAAESDAADDASGDASGDADASGGEQDVDWDARLVQERERITKENQRKIDERNDNLDKARETVRELNYRFADWYYVISEDMYKKIHLTHTDIIQETEEAKKEGFGPDALRDLESRGIEGLPGLPDAPGSGN